VPRIVFGLIVPFIIIAVVWLLGSPSSFSLFWKTTDAVIVGHETYEAETGYGLYPFHAPLVKIENREQALRIKLAGAPEMKDIKVAWPLGKQVRVKLNPSGSMAIATDDPNRSYTVALIVLVVGLLIIGLTFTSYFIALDTMSLAFGVFGLAFIVIPLLILVFRWQTGYPPPSAHVFWPSEKAKIMSQKISSQRIGNGTIRHTPVIEVMLAQTVKAVRVDGYLGGPSRKDAEQVLARGGLGTMLKVNISPTGVPFEARWNIQQILTVIFTILLPIFLLVGWVFLRIAWPSHRNKP
jgi:hypothetical protein